MLVAAKIAITAGASALDVAGTIEAAEKTVRERVPVARVIYPEPDIDRGAVSPQ